LKNGKNGGRQLTFIKRLQLHQLSRDYTAISTSIVPV